MTATRKVQISVKDVSKSYKMGEVIVHALNGITLDVKEGEFLVVLGPSGSGKTTLLNMIGGIDTVGSGTIVTDGLPITALNERHLNEYRRNYIGFVFQFFNLIPTLTALENVAFAAELVKNPADPLAMLDEVGLKDRANHFPSELSGGEQQRVAIARAMAKNPPILLCDEPTGDLDFETGNNVLKVIQNVKRNANKTVILITHNTIISSIADRVVRLRSGQIIDVTENLAPLSAEKLTW